MRNNRQWPPMVAVAGGGLYGLGVFLTRFTHRLAWLYLAYGLVGGIGLALTYLMPGCAGETVSGTNGRNLSA